jgi:CRP-like cAMP-binding protein
VILDSDDSPTLGTRIAAPDRGTTAALLDLDPDLGQLLEPDALAAARRLLGARVVHLRSGPWDVERLQGADPTHLGLLVVDGMLSRELLAEDVASMELIGPGDIVRPWQEDGIELLEARSRWGVLADVRLAVLDRTLAGRLARFPEIYAVIVERMSARSQRLSVTQAIAQLNRVDRRLMLLFWHLAERWGRVTTQGVHVPLILAHRTLAQLIGARRPTVSTALTDLVRRGELRRTPGGTWVLCGDPPGRPAAEFERHVRPRRQLLGRDGR